MFRNIAVLFCLLLVISENFATWQLIIEKLLSADQNITRVRTVEERNRRSGENVVLDFIGLVEQYDGYTAEEYEVQTHDGYILTLHRISGSPSSPKAPGKPVVYLQHGLFGSSDFHVVLGPEQALTFYLADLGYDVWLGNVRGNTYSKRHVKYSNTPSNRHFWNFSMHEMGAIDVPKFIDTVLEKTSQSQVTYIGYSMGTTLSYILLSTRPEYNEKINLVINIAPVVYFSPPYSPLLNVLLTLAESAKALVLAKRVYQILPQSKFIQILGKDVCANESGKQLCRGILSTVVNIKNINITTLPTILAHVPAGTSLNTVDHYYQMIKTGKFCNYIPEISGNSNKYRSFSVPSYDLSKVTTKQALFYSADDVYASVRDVTKLKNTLKNVVAFERAPVQSFNHLDFMWAVNARKIVYDRLIGCIKQYV